MRAAFKESMFHEISFIEFLFLTDNLTFIVTKKEVSGDFWSFKL